MRRRGWVKSAAASVLIALVGSQLALGAQGTTNRRSGFDPSGGLVSHWTFDEGSGAQALDSVPASGNNGTIMGADYTADAAHDGSTYSLGFDADASDRVVVPDAPSLDFASDRDLTIGIWAKRTANVVRYDVLGKRVSGMDTSNYQISRDASGLYFDSGDADTGRVNTSVQDLPFSIWAHIGVTYSDNTLRIFLNGNLVGTAEGFTLATPNDAPLKIGGSGSSPFGFVGYLDDARIYDRALSPDDMKKLALTSDFISHWKLDEREGGTALDSEDNNPGAIYRSSYSTTDKPTFDGNESALFGSQEEGSEVVVQDSPLLDLENNETFSWALWARRTGEQSSQYLIGKRSSCTSSANYELNRSGSVLTFGSASFGQDLPLDRWTHIAVTYDGDGTLHAYVDGNLATKDTSFSLGPVNAGTLEFGSSSDCPEHFEGGLDDIRLYRRTLSEDEVDDLAGERMPAIVELTAPTYAASEGGGEIRASVKRSGDLSETVTVDYATMDATAVSSVTADRPRPTLGRKVVAVDYTGTNGVLSFGPGDTEIPILVPVFDDREIEGDESASIALSNPGGEAMLGLQTSATLTIVDNDPTVSFVEPTSTFNEGQRGARIEVVLSDLPPRVGATIGYRVTGGTATAGTDYVLSSGSLTFTGRITKRAIPLTLLNDRGQEPNETIDIELTPSMGIFGGLLSHTVTIVDPLPGGDLSGDTPELALALDTITRPRQDVSDALSSDQGDAADMYKIHLDAGDKVFLEVGKDKTSAVPFAGQKTLSIRNADNMQIGGPVTGGTPRLLFEAASTGDHFVRVEARSGVPSRYKLHVHRLALASGLIDPSFLDEDGPMFAWLSDSMVEGWTVLGVTGPTGYGFGLEGAWIQSVHQVPGRSVGSDPSVVSTYRLPQGSVLTVHSGAGDVVIPATPFEITVTTKPSSFGATFGAVNGNEITTPIRIPMDWLTREIELKHGGDIDITITPPDVPDATITPSWSIKLGGEVSEERDVRELLAGVPYFTVDVRPQINISFGGNSYAFDYDAAGVLLAIDPADPSFLLRLPDTQGSGGPATGASTRGPKIRPPALGGLKRPALGFSLRGFIPFRAIAEPELTEGVGITRFYSHVFVQGGRTVPVYGVPITFVGGLSVDVDANDDGMLLGGQGNADELFKGDLSLLANVFRDLNLGMNTDAFFEVQVSLKGIHRRLSDAIGLLDIPIAKASAVYNGDQRALWFRGEVGGDPFEGVPYLEFLTSLDQEDSVEAVVDTQGRFRLVMGTKWELLDLGSLEGQLEINNQGVELSAEGRLGYSIKVDFGDLGKVTCRASLSVDASIDLSLSGGELYLAGSAGAKGSGKCGKVFPDFDFDVSGKFSGHTIVFKIPHMPDLKLDAL